MGYNVDVVPFVALQVLKLDSHLLHLSVDLIKLLHQVGLGGLVLLLGRGDLLLQGLLGCLDRGQLPLQRLPPLLGILGVLGIGRWL